MGIFKQVAEQKGGGVFAQAAQKNTVNVGGVPINTGQQSTLGKIGSAITKNERAFGQSIAGSAIGRGLDAITPGVSAEAQQAQADTQNIELAKNIISAIKTTREKGGDTSKYLKMLQQVPGYEGMSSAEQVLADKSAQQIVGESTGVLTDIVAGGVTPKSFIGAVGAGAGLGAASSASSALQEDKSLTDVAKQATLGGAIGGVTGGLFYGAGKAIEKAGEKVYKFFIPKSAKEARLVQAYKANNPVTERIKIALTGAEGKTAPVTAADTAFEQGLKGTESMIGIQAKRAQNNIWKGFVEPALDESKVQVNMPKFFDDIEEKIIKETPELGRKNALLEGLTALREDYANVGDVPLSKLQQFKEGWAQFVPDKAYNGKPIAGVYNDVKNKAAGLARQAIYSALGPEAKKAYFDYGNLQAITKLGQVAMTGGKLKGGAGSFISAVKDMALIPVATVGGRTLYRVGNLVDNIEVFGPAGATKLSEVISSSLLNTLQGEKEAK